MGQCDSDCLCANRIFIIHLLPTASEHLKKIAKTMVVGLMLPKDINEKFNQHQMRMCHGRSHQLRRKFLLNLVRVLPHRCHGNQHSIQKAQERVKLRKQSHNHAPTERKKTNKSGKDMGRDGMKGDSRLSDILPSSPC